MRDSKLIALVPFRNEAEFLPAYFKGLKNIVDEVVGLDDTSKDGSNELFLAGGGSLVLPDRLVPWSKGGEPLARNTLLEAGRDLGGTHFLWLDADEVPSQTLSHSLRARILALKPGESLEAMWVNAWKNSRQYRRRLILGDPNFRLFAHADLPTVKIQGEGMHFQKVPSDLGLFRDRVQKHEGAIVHLQFCAWQRARAKQAWYQVTEMIQDSRGTLQIRLRYRDTARARPGSIRCLPRSWQLDPSVEASLESLELNDSVGRQEIIKEILALLDQCPIELFEPLEIWDVPELFALFKTKVGRPPNTIPLPQHYNLAADISERVRLVKLGSRMLRNFNR